ncbi:MAG: helix-turn-helix domain-containing protein [Methanosarcinaceae archaeon]
MKNEIELSKKRFMSKKELSLFLNISIYTIDAWVSEKREIPHIKMGRRVLFDMTDINNWLKDNKIYPVNFDKSDGLN